MHRVCVCQNNPSGYWAPYKIHTGPNEEASEKFGMPDRLGVARYLTYGGDAATFFNGIAINRHSLTYKDDRSYKSYKPTVKSTAALIAASIGMDIGRKL